MSKIYTCGDTHGGSVGDMQKLNSTRFFSGTKLTKDDYVIQLGDFGCVWSRPGTPRYKEDLHWQKWLQNKPWTTLFIDGNHENHDMLDELEQVPMFGGMVGKVNDSIYHLKRGRVYTIAGKTFFTMGGAESIDKEGRCLGTSYWHQEVPNYAEIDQALAVLEKHDWKVDYVLTHTCPTYVAEMLLSVHDLSEGGTYCNKVNDPTCNFLEHIYSKLSFKMWYYGHWHQDWKYNNFICQYNSVLQIGG